MEELARFANPTVLAAFELDQVGAPVEDLPGTERNIAVAQALGQLQLDVDAETCTGFVAFLRLSGDQLLQVARSGQRLFGVEENTPNGPVCFLMEQVNTAGRQALLRRMRHLSSLDGVEVLAGWRGDRLRCHKVVR